MKFKLVAVEVIQKIKTLIRKDDYSYIYYDSYLSGEKRLVKPNFKFDKITELCEIMMKNGTDKAGYSGLSKHNYTVLYSNLFEKLRNHKINIFELGLGTNNIAVPSNMGQSGVPGASLRGWKEYFSNANIFGADIDEDILFHEDRIKTFYCDQTNPGSIGKMWEKVGNINFKIIVDDGLHQFEANRCFLENSIHKLDHKGIYVIEDVVEAELELWRKYLLGSKLINVRFTIVKVPNPFNENDNNLIFINKF